MDDLYQTIRWRGYPSSRLEIKPGKADLPI
jgi:hypothetical protein